MKGKLEQVSDLLGRLLQASLGKDFAILDIHFFSDAFRIECVIKGHKCIIGLSLHHLDLPWEIVIMEADQSQSHSLSFSETRFHKIDCESFYVTPAALNDSELLKVLVTQVVEELNLRFKI